MNPGNHNPEDDIWLIEKYVFLEYIFQTVSWSVLYIVINVNLCINYSFWVINDSFRVYFLVIRESVERFDGSIKAYTSTFELFIEFPSTDINHVMLAKDMKIILLPA